MPEHAHPTKLGAIASRWLGVGLAAIICAVTLGLTLTGRLALYINPDGAWFAVGMAVLGLVGAAASFALPLGAEADHGHDHGTASAGHGATSVGHHHDEMPTQPRTRAELRQARTQPPKPVQRQRARIGSMLVAGIGGVLASVVALSALVLPPATLSAQLATERDLGNAPLFGGDDAIQLATMGDVSSFGIGEWATVFQSTPDPRALDGIDVVLTGFVTPGDDGSLRLTRLVITHCVIDAQPAGIPVQAEASTYATGQWVEVSGTVRELGDGSLVVTPTTITEIAEPVDPYEY